MKKLLVLPIVIILSITMYFCSKDPVATNPYSSHYDPAEWMPSNLTLTEENIHTIRLTWQQQENNIDGFRIDKKNGSGNWQTATVDANTKTYTDTGAVLNETNYYRIYAYADKNNSGYLDTNIVHQIAPPTNLTATAINDESIQLAWNDNCDFESGYTVERSTAGGSYAEIADLSANSEQYTDEGLSFGIDYTYRVRAYTVNNHSDYSSEQTSNVNVLTDIEGNVYQVVKIGNQWWMAENLKVTKYRNGESIQKVTDGTQWSNLDDNETPAYCAYNNDESNADTYGYLYNWYAVDDSRNIAPEGWHVPTDDEWQELEDFLTNNGHSGTEGKALKSTSGWNSDGNGTDDYGFAGLPAGCRNGSGAFGDMGYDATFWSASEYSTNLAWTRYLYYNYSGVTRYNIYKVLGFSVRCVRD